MEKNEAVANLANAYAKCGYQGPALAPQAEWSVRTREVHGRRIFQWENVIEVTISLGFFQGGDETWDDRASPEIAKKEAMWPCSSLGWTILQWPQHIWCFNCLPSGNQTWQWKMDHLSVIFQIETSIHRGLSIAMFDYQRVICLTLNDSHSFLGGMNPATFLATVRQ